MSNVCSWVCTRSTDFFFKYGTYITYSVMFWNLRETALLHCILSNLSVGYIRVHYVFYYYSFNASIASFHCSNNVIQNFVSRLIAGITATHRNAHSSIDTSRMCDNRTRRWVLPALRSWRNCAIGGCSTAEWHHFVTFAAAGVCRIISVCLFRAALDWPRRTADEKRSTFFVTNKIVKHWANGIRAEHDVRCGLYIAGWPSQFGVLSKNTVEAHYVSEYCTHLIDAFTHRNLMEARATYFFKMRIEEKYEQ